jgi:D-amino peptidase
MKAYVSVDLEGLPGVASITMTTPWSSQFSIASKVMTRLVNAAVDELYSCGFEEVVVADSHGYMTNVNYLELDSRASLIQGYPRVVSMVNGLDESYNAVVFIGYHAAAGTPHGFLEHTFSGRVFAEIRLNGVRASEYLINTLYASERKVPAILLAGDEHLRGEVENYTPWVTFVPLKRGITRYAAHYPSIERAEKALREGVRDACGKLRRGAVKLLDLSKPYTVELVFRDSLIVDALEGFGPFERVDAYTVRLVANNMWSVLRAIEIAAYVGSAILSMAATIR